MFYEDVVFQHFDNPFNTGLVANHTHKSMLGNSHNGVLIQLTAKVENNIIEQIAFKAYGGVAIIASMSLLTQKVKGKSIDDALKFTNEELSENLHLDSSNYIYAIMAIDSLQKLFCST